MPGNMASMAMPIKPRSKKWEPTPLRINIPADEKISPPRNIKRKLWWLATPVVKFIMASALKLPF